MHCFRLLLGLVIDELKRLAEVEREKQNAADGMRADKHAFAALPEAAKKKKNVYEVFRRYDGDGSDSLDR